jgi:hypothetical protein
VIGDVHVVGTPGIEISFLQKDEVGLRARQELDDPSKLQSLVDIPVDNADGIRRTKHPARDCKIACLDVLHGDHTPLQQ